jgi:hypothetical protein
MLQSEAGYIDARPHIRQLDEVLLQRTAGPYMWVKRYRLTRPRSAGDVRFYSDSVGILAAQRNAASCQEQMRPMPTTISQSGLA